MIKLGRPLNLDIVLKGNGRAEQSAECCPKLTSLSYPLLSTYEVESREYLAQELIA